MNRTTTLFLGAMAAFLGACSDSNNAPAPAPLPPPPPTAEVQVLHASPDAPAVNVAFSGTGTITGGDLSNVDYKAGTRAIPVFIGDYNVQVDAITPGGAATVIDADLNFAANTQYTIIAAGLVNSTNPPLTDLGPIVLEQPVAFDNANVRLRVLHAAPNAPTVDVYATAPGAMLEPGALVGTFSFTEDLGPIEVAPGDYQISVTLENDPGTVVFDSGTVSLTAGSDLVLAAVENTFGGSSPISLALLNGMGSAEIMDVNETTRFRVVHASHDAPNVDVIIDDAVLPLVVNLAFPDFTNFFDVAPATYNVKVSPTGTGAAGAVIDADLPLDAAQTYDVLAIDNVATISALVANDDPRRVATESKVRIIHAAPAAGNVDIWVTAPGADITDPTVTPLLTDIPFGANTGFLSVAPGTYDVNVAPTGTTTAAITQEITVAAAGIYTAVARENTGGMGGLPLGLILLDDFN